MPFNIRVEVDSSKIVVFYGDGSTAVFREGQINFDGIGFKFSNPVYGTFYKEEFQYPVGAVEVTFEVKVRGVLSGPRQVILADAFVANDLVNGTNAEIAWSTRFDSESNQVLFGLSSSYNDSKAESPANLRSHKINLTALLGGTTYHYSCISKAAGAAADSPQDFFVASADADFDTIALPIDDVTLLPTFQEISSGGFASLKATPLVGGRPQPNRVVRFGSFPGNNPLPGRFDPSDTITTNPAGEAEVSFYPSRPGMIHLEANCEGRAARVTIKVRN